MDKVIKNFQNISYGPAPEDSKEVNSWIKNLKNPNNHFINGKFVKSSSSKKLNIINPSTNKKIATLTAVKYKNPKGILTIDKKSKIKNIKEKPLEFINGGFFVLSSNIFKYLNDSKNIFEKHCLPKLTQRKQLLAYKHNGFWACMDTMREKNELNKIWKSKTRAWKVWL